MSPPADSATIVEQLGALVVFTLDDSLYALPLADVERVVWAVAITPLPEAPAIVLGIINIQGRIVPVVNVRRRFKLPERAIRLNDQFLIATTPRRTIALVVDSVREVRPAYSSEEFSADFLPETEYVEGVVRTSDGLILVHDLSRFLSLDEESTLESVLPSIRDGQP